MNPIFSRAASRRGAFTLIQLGVVLAILVTLAALLFPALTRARHTAHRQNCDVRLKSIALALDAFKSERGTYPAKLETLQSEGYLTDPDALHCGRDPRVVGGAWQGYDSGYVRRAPGDAGELPVVTCPFHEDAEGGNQARLGRFTTQFATRPAVLTSGNAVQVQRAGESKPVAGYAGMPLRGGDRLSVGGVGTALVTFADGSTARLQRGAQVSVLQSFIDGHSGAPLYTLLRQTLGDVTYSVHHGSRFDVATPAATAGARGTAFRLKVSGNQPKDSELFVIEGKVVWTNASRSGVAPLGKWLSATVADLVGLLRFLR